MVKSPKTGRELHGQRVYKGSPWVANLVSKYLGPSDDEREPRDGR